MRTNRIRPIVCVITLCMLSLSVSFSVSAQISKLREQPKQEEKFVVPIAEQPSIINVNISLNKPCGSAFYTNEKALIYFQSDADGYVTLYDIDTKGNVLVIFPNRNTPDNFVRRGQRYQIPAEQADYDLIVEGPEGIEYIEAVASTDPYYHWNHTQGEPRWLKGWGLKGRGLEAGHSASPANPVVVTALKQSSELQNLPKEFGAIGLDSITRNFELSQGLREQVRSRLVVRPHETETLPAPKSEPAKPQPQQPQPTQIAVNYSTASCYMYIVDTTASGSQTSKPQNVPQPGESPSAPKAEKPLAMNLWFDQRCGTTYDAGSRHRAYFQADADGYVTVYQIDTNGNLSIIFPNRYTPDNAVRAGQTYAIADQDGDVMFTVQGPEGVAYLSAIASVDPYYHWNARNRTPFWLSDWGLTEGTLMEIDVNNADLKNSLEFKNRPPQFGKTAMKSLIRNYKIAQSLKEQASFKIETRVNGAPQQYSTASCYMYVLGR